MCPPILYEISSQAHLSKNSELVGIVAPRARAGGDQAELCRSGSFEVFKTDFLGARQCDATSEATSDAAASDRLLFA